MPTSRLPEYPAWVLRIARSCWLLTLAAGVTNVGLIVYALGVRDEGWNPGTALQLMVGVIFLVITPLMYKITRTDH